MIVSDDAFSPLESEMKNWDNGTLLGKMTGSMLAGSAVGVPDQFPAVDQALLPEPLVQVLVAAAASCTAPGASAAAPSANANNRLLLARVRAARAVIWLAMVTSFADVSAKRGANRLVALARGEMRVEAYHNVAVQADKSDTPR